MSDPLTVIIGGALAGLCADTIVHPISTIKTRLQADTGSKTQSVWRTGVTLVQREGWRKLYTGFGVYAFSAPGRAAYFGGLEVANHMGSLVLGPNHPATGLVAGPIAQLAGSLMWVPMDVVRERMQVQSGTNPQYRNPLHTARQLIVNEGPRSLYRGFIVHQLLWGPFNTIFWPLYATMCQTRWTDPFGLFPACVSAGVAGFLTAPVDTIKVRLQIEAKQQSAYECTKRCLQQEGVQGLFKGAAARVLWIAPNMAMTVSLYKYWTRTSDDESAGEKN